MRKYIKSSKDYSQDLCKGCYTVDQYIFEDALIDELSKSNSDYDYYKEIGYASQWNPVEWRTNGELVVKNVSGTFDSYRLTKIVKDKFHIPEDIWDIHCYDGVVYILTEDL